MMRTLKHYLVLVLIFIAALAQAQSATAPADAERRANDILSKMSLEEKIDYIGGYNEFYIRAIPRLGVPELVMADGPLGVRNYGPSTAYPSGIAMAATWNTELERRVGTMMGKDARARGSHFLLAPGMNIYRAPMCGRNFEYFGEDPFLASRMAVADIQGIQSAGVIATAKHFLGNNQEWDRHHVSSDIDERTVREIYLPAFEASVKEGKVGAIMDSYNLVNGVHMTQNGYFNTEVLRNEWGFKGIVMSDWDATYDGVAAANGGLDLEMPNGKFMNRETLLAAVKAGKVSEATIDEKVRRILSTAIRFGFFDRAQKDASIPLDNPEARQVALQGAREGIVLLKNNGLLPFDQAKLKNIAVIGPNANISVAGGGGSSQLKPFSEVTLFEGIRKIAGKGVNVTYAPGVPVAKESFKKTAFSTTPDGKTPGLTAEYFNNVDLKGEPALTRTDAHVAFDWSLGSYAEGQPIDNFSARWTGYYTPEHSGKYALSVSGDDGFRLYIDDKLVIDDWNYQGETLVTKPLELEAGKAYKVRLEYFEGTGEAVIGFGIADALNTPELNQATEMAKKADAVVLCIGFNSAIEGEGFDRSFELPVEQQQLIKNILAANKKVAVVVTAGGAVDMNDWIDTAPALLHTWYPGQEGGTALGEILFGVINPSGKLPASFERRWQDNATFNSYYDKKGSKHVAYTEGVFLGYRHYDKTGIAPLFPFGYGLSYTTFKYSGLKITPASTRDGQVTVSFAITNTGKRAGAEIAQVYVSDTHAKVPRPVKELKGFAKVSLAPGKTQTVTVKLDRRAFSYYDVNTKQWVAAPGEFQILVGSSSKKIEAQGKVVLAQ